MKACDSNSFYTLTIKNDIRIFRAATHLHDQLVDHLKTIIPGGNFLTQCLFQPLPAHGNITSPSVLWVAILVVQNPSHESLASEKFRTWTDAVREYASFIDNGVVPWVYMNYADKRQQPLATENVQRLRDVAGKYDPQEVFQKLCPGGWKISGV